MKVPAALRPKGRAWKRRLPTTAKTMSLDDNSLAVGDFGGLPNLAHVDPAPLGLDKGGRAKRSPQVNAS